MVASSRTWPHATAAFFFFASSISTCGEKRPCADAALAARFDGMLTFY